ncbi:hypothetical protein BDV23DRAFT_18963 [Aspergillus alliaceus]|uniref:Uncharacterized protein n=1 Tax=Petromyces alliaceus TaxID=209559 RepID=A0A5N7BU90_PETAA|nr:hypothetical protein BDV23DRAFT_18963 [Aspergillus alliaceus]
MPQDQGWTWGANRRGTLDILWTCISTLALCVWTAIHPNIPLVYRTWPTFLERLGLMFLAIVFPEVIISSAWSQRRRAKELLYDVNRSIGRTATGPASQETPIHTEAEISHQGQALLSPLSNSDQLAHKHFALIQSHDQSSKVAPWSIQHGMFGVMGGFAIETPYVSPTGERHTLRRLITPAGISILAHAGYLPSLAPEDIAERSKADLFAKGVVLVQIIWFALQVLGRLSQGLPVTPLETHTAIHVGCTILVYAIWASKPYNLVQSIKLSGPDIIYIGAFFNFQDISGEVFHQEQARYRLERMEYWKRRVILASQGVSPTELPPSPPRLKSITQLIEDYSSRAIRTEAVHYTYKDEAILHAIAQDARQGLYILEKKGYTNCHGSPPGETKLLRQSSENFTVKAIWGGWSTDIGHEPSLDKGIHILFNVLYGGSHLAAWNSAFPTTPERWLWRGCALYLTTLPFWAILWILWWRGVKSRLKILYLIRNGSIDIIAASLFFTVLVCYTLARCYFLVEALIGLRRLPSTAFDIVHWTSFLPHVS